MLTIVDFVSDPEVVVWLVLGMLGVLASLIFGGARFLWGIAMRAAKQWVESPLLPMEQRLLQAIARSEEENKRILQELRTENVRQHTELKEEVLQLRGDVGRVHDRMNTTDQRQVRIIQAQFEMERRIDKIDKQTEHE